MAKKLVDLEIDKVAGVDAAANRRTWLIVKRHEDVEKQSPPGSYEALSEKIREAYAVTFSGSNCWTAATFDDHVIVSEYSDNGQTTWYSIPWATLDGEITFGERKEVEQRISYLTKALHIWEKGGEEMQKAGKAISSANMGKIAGVMATMQAAMDKIKSFMGNDQDEEGMTKGADNMPISKEVFESLPEDVQKHLTAMDEKVAKTDELQTSVDDLTAKVAELTKDEKPSEDEILKGASDEVKKAMDDLKKQAEEATEIAKAERELRIAKQYEDEAKDLPGLGDNVAKMLRTADGVSEEAGKELRETLKAAQAQIDLTKEIGRPSGDKGGDAWAKIEAGAAALVQKNADLTKEQAEAEFLKTAEGRALYQEYSEENAQREVH